MGLEVVEFIPDLVPTNPDGAVDYKSAGDDHIRNIKKALKQTFLGALQLRGAVETYAELKALSVPAAGSKGFVLVAGRTSVGDGGEGFFRWNPTSVTADDAGTILVPNAAPAAGRWERMFMTGVWYASWWGFSTAATAAVNKAAIVATLAAIGHAKGAIIQLGRGQFLCDPGIAPDRKSIVFQGVGTTGYELSNGGTELVFTAGAYAFNFTALSGTIALNDYCEVRRMTLNGNNACTSGIGIKGAIVVEDVEAVGFVADGFDLVDWINSTVLNRVSGSYNGGWGYRARGANSTIHTVCDSVFRRNGNPATGAGGGMNVESGTGICWNGRIGTESNYGPGILIKHMNGGGVIYGILGNTIHAENNGQGYPNQDDAYNLVIDMETPSVNGGPGQIYFDWFKSVQPSGSDPYNNARHAYINCAYECDLGVKASNFLGGRHIAGVQQQNIFINANATAVTFGGFRNGGVIVDAANRHHERAPTTNGSAGYRHTKWLMEHSRSYGMGETQTRAFAAGNYTASGAMIWTLGAADRQQESWRIVGDTMTFSFVLRDTHIAAPVDFQLRILIPEGRLAGEDAAAAINISVEGVEGVGTALVVTGQPYIYIQRSAMTVVNWTASAGAGNTWVQGQITFKLSAP